MFLVDYDKNNANDILRHAKQIEGLTLRHYLEQIKQEYHTNIEHKGRLGNLVEEILFGYKQNSNQEADFKEVGMELKVTPLKYVKNKLETKERLVLSMINYKNIVNETWDNNSILKKLQFLLLMFYIHEKDKDVLDLIFDLISLWRPSQKDLDIIKNDWQIIVNKVKNGKAHEISEGDTNYLGACTKAADSTKITFQPFSDIPAKPRAFSLKPSYLRTVYQELKHKKIKEITKDLDFEKVVIEKFKPILNLSMQNISNQLDININTTAKNRFDLLFKEIQKKLFGDQLKNLAEFQKSGIQVKTIILRQNGTLQESMSFPHIEYTEIINQEWDLSDVKEMFENQKHLWIICRATKKYKQQRDLDLCDVMLEKIMFWNMPEEDLENDVYKLWQDTVNKVKNDDYLHFLKSKDNPVSHIRPHARNEKDKILSPQGKMEKKHCFWLNSKYITKQINLHDQK